MRELKPGDFVTVKNGEFTHVGVIDELHANYALVHLIEVSKRTCLLTAFYPSRPTPLDSLVKLAEPAPNDAPQEEA